MFHHLVRLNVWGSGYGLYTGRPGETFAGQPLDVVSPGVSQAYLHVQRRLDDACERGLSWTVAIRCEGTLGRPIVGYAGTVPGADDKGRVGIRVLHAVELDDMRQVWGGLQAITRILSPSALGRLSAVVGQVASGSQQLAFALAQISQDFEDRWQAGLGRSAPAGHVPSPQDPRRVAHDCAGAAPLAWLALAAPRIGSTESWELFETVDGRGVGLSCLDTAAETPVVNASTLFADAVEGSFIRRAAGSLPTTSSSVARVEMPGWRNMVMRYLRRLIGARTSGHRVA